MNGYNDEKPGLMAWKGFMIRMTIGEAKQKEEIKPENKESRD
jgi:hypothetical protein